MNIASIKVRNVRSIASLEWKLPRLDATAGWHVVIGDNGSGKSTFLRSVALSLVGPREAAALRQDWNDWLRRGEEAGMTSVVVLRNKAFDGLAGRGGALGHRAAGAVIAFRRTPAGVLIRSQRDIGDKSADRHIWANARGWFSASYGPFRRFGGGDPELERLTYTNPKLARHLSVFGERVALSEALRWLQELQFRYLEHADGSEGRLLGLLTRFINQPGFLPHDAILHEVTSRGVVFKDANGSSIDVTEMSDGYRSVLSMTFDLIRQLSATFGPDKVFDPADPTKVVVPGVVLIDEIDAHLHPTWQRQIGFWFRKHFPRMQFIVTTHSPLVCQAAEQGTIFRLPKPGSNESGRMIEGEERDRLIYGNVLDAYGTEAFGRGVTRSEEGKQRLARLAELNIKELESGLVPEEREEQERLRHSTPTAASTLEKGLASS